MSRLPPSYQRLSLLASSISLALVACGGGDADAPTSANTATSARPADTASALAATTRASADVGTTADTTSARPPRTDPPPIAPYADAASFTDPAAPLLLDIGDRTYSAPVLVGNLHNPNNYKIAPKVPAWQFASADPTNGVLTFEREVAPDNGWHGFSRAGRVRVTGGAKAAANRVYTVFNREQLLAALREAKNEPKIIRIVGHIDFRWSEGNTVFREYTSFDDQKNGGSFAIPSNTTLVGINDALGRPARITGTQILIGKEAALTPGGDPEADFKAWVNAGKDPELYPTWTRNVIVRNLMIDTPWDVNPEDSGNAYMDGITISRGQYIWIDHVGISDGDTPDSLASDTRHDGGLDIVRGSDYVTVANSTFTKHGKLTLVGNGDSGRAWSDAGRLHVTFTGNWWNHAGSRMPLARYGQVHLYNNLVSGSTSTSNSDLKFAQALDVRYKSDVISEGNFYEFTGLKPREVCGKLAGGKPSEAISFRSSGHRFISDKDDNGQVMAAPIDVELQGCEGLLALNNWVPPYAYTLRSADNLRTAIKASAGAGRLGLFALAGPTPEPAPGAPAPSPGPAPEPPAPPPPSPPPPAPEPGDGPGCTVVLPCSGDSGEVLLSPLVTAPVPVAVYDATTGTYTLSGAGNMSNSNSYNFNFKYTPLVGDFTFTARVLVQGGSAASARAGIVAITGLNTSAQYAWTARYASTGEIRAAIQGDGKSAISGFSTSTLPVWVRVQRRGTALYSAASTDGITWAEKTNLSVSASTLYVGLALSSGSNTATVEAQFDNVSIVGGGR
jgi:pectate lyase